MSSAAKGKKGEAPAALVYEVDPKECPFREFRDSELGSDLWGLGPGATRATLAIMGKGTPKNTDTVWADDQTQPLPRSVRMRLNGWARAEEVAYDLWENDVEIFDEGGSLMSVIEYQTSHSSVLTRSSFSRRVLSACFMLERAEGLVVEHQWENFNCTMAPEKWRAKYHIYSPGMKSGGGPAHKPSISRNGCYLVRLFFLGMWRCVWVSDQVPVDSNGAPLLPFAPLIYHTLAKPGTKAPPTTVISSEVYLWPLLLCKALLKLAAPDMNSDEDWPGEEDEPMKDFDILHALTGCLHMKYHFDDPEKLWQLLITEVPVFSWDDDDETNASTVKSKAARKSTTKDLPSVRLVGIATIELPETKNEAPYTLPGITPAYAMSLMISMVRDVPIKKPLPEPDVAPWKYYRWVDWARDHGMYEAYDCPREKFLKVNGLMKLSCAPHLLDVMSTESITVGFREEQDKAGGTGKKGTKDAASKNQQTSLTNTLAMKEEMKEWVQFDNIQKWITRNTILFYPSVFEFTSAGDATPIRVTKSTPNRAIDMLIPKTAPLYLQIDGPEPILLRISLAMLHPRVMFNCGIPIADYIEPAYILVEEFDLFGGNEIPLAKAYLENWEYECLEMNFPQGRHYCRIWVHSRMNCHIMLLSESSVLLGTRDLIFEAASHERAWSARFLSNLGTAFSTWIRVSRSSSVVTQVAGDRDFYMSYMPDLEWDPEVVGYNQALLHWMFRQALQSFLAKKLLPTEFESVCAVLRRHFLDPDFGFPPKPLPGRSLREVVANEPCDCLMPEVEETELNEEILEENVDVMGEEKPLVSQSMMEKLLTAPVEPDVSQICDMATEELPCGVLKDEREKFLKRHDAATYLQALWRGAWARKCLRGHLLIASEVIKSIMENAFGSLETLSALMNEFFHLFPGAKSAYSVASALSGSYSLTQHTGVSHVTPECKWIPYFQVVYFCHGPVKVHFDLQSSLPQSSYMVFDNDTGEQLPQTYNAHLTFDFKINNSGYTVFAHGTLNQASGHAMDAQWQFTVLTSVEGFFHICDNDINLAGTGCNELQMVPSYKLHINEIFLPNRRNILGGILISVTKHEAVSFRAAATSPDLQMVATLGSIQGDLFKEIAHCSGIGEIYWPFISLKPRSTSMTTVYNNKKRSASHANLYNKDSQGFSARSLKVQKPKPASAGRNRTLSSTKIKDKTLTFEPKTYSIQVTVPDGWPLTLAQWMRVDEIRNSLETAKAETPSKKQTKPEKGKAGASKVPAHPPPKHEPLPGDAFVELECSLTSNGGAIARRDDLRDLELQAAIKSWDANELGRNLKGAAIRQEFRLEFLETPAAPSSMIQSSASIPEEIFEEEEFDESKKEQLPQGPTPATETEMEEMEPESEEEPKFLNMPDQLKDKFTPLQFLPLCLRDQYEEVSVIMSSDMAEAARQDRIARIDASTERMRELQVFNERHVLGQQAKRTHLLENIFVDSQWAPELAAVLDERDEAIIREVLMRQLSANKKKVDAKVQSSKK